MKISALPEGTVIELSMGERYERSSNWVPLDHHSYSPIAFDALDDKDNVKIISVPYEVTLKLAEWLDKVYTKTGTPESLIIEASVDAFKTKHDSRISDRPRKASDEDLGITVKSEEEARLVIDTLVGMVETYGSASVADLYDLVGIPPTFVDTKWGWKADLIKKITIRQIENDYVLVFPKSESLKDG